MANGGLTKFLYLGGGLVSIIGAAVGYGTLSNKVEENAASIAEVRNDLAEKASAPNASAAGSQLEGEIRLLASKLDDLKQQATRIESKLDDLRRARAQLGN